MRPSPRSPLALVAVLSLVAGAVLAQDATEPVVRARPPAKPVSFEQTLTMNDVLSGATGKPQPTAISILHDVTCSAAGDKAEDTGRIQFDYRRARVSAETPMGAGTFDSDDHDPVAKETLRSIANEGEVAEFYALSFAMMGRRKLEAGLAPEGTVTVASGLGPVLEGIKGIRSTQFGPSLIEDTAHRPELLFLALGDGPHALGSTWKREVSWIAPVGGPRVRSEVTYEVTSVDDDTITVTYAGEPELVLEWGEVSDEDRAPVEWLQKMFRSRLDSHVLEQGTFSGEATISRADGLPETLSWSLELEMTFEVMESELRTKTKLTNAVKRVPREE